MRTLFCAILCLLFFVFQLKAQNSPDCRTVIPVCADAPINSIANGRGDINDFDPDVIGQTGCLEKGSINFEDIENNTAWYVFRAGTDGQIGFDIEALPVTPGNPVTAEYDFALYGPFDQTSGDNFCGNISNGTEQPIRCNYEVNDTNFTGMGVNPENGQVGAPNVTGSQNTYDEYLDVVAGEVYYLFINNFNTNSDGDPENFILTFTGSSVNANQNNALDCTLRDEFLGFDIIACEGDPDIVLSALNSPAGPNIDNIIWEVDTDNDGIPDAQLATGAGATEFTVTSPNSGRYFVTIETTLGGPPITDDILITFYGVPVLQDVIVREDLLVSDDPERYIVEIIVDGNGDYEYSLNGGEYQDEPIFSDVPPGLNTVVINDKNGCGFSAPMEFVVVGYPKFFTPNGDGVHDLWQVLGINELTDPDVFIFDRYGKLLKQLDETDTGWDGTFNGRQLPSSDYWFRLDYERDEQAIVVAKTVRNHFSLVR